MGKMIIAMVIAVALISTALAGEKKCNSVNKAEDLWNYNLKSEALACLDEVIQADPTNTKAHFLKGKMCLAMDNYDCAHERFIAAPVRAKHGNEIATLYKAIGDNRFASGNTKEAEGYYREASLYNPSVSKEAAKEVFTKGAQIGNDNFLYLAARLDPSLKQAVSDYYHSLSKAAPRKEDQIDLLGKAAEYDNTRMTEYTENKEALGRFHLEEGKKWAKVPGKEQVTDDHRQAARKYLGEAVVESELPEVVILSPRTEPYRFDIKKGEKTPFKLWGEQGVRTTQNFFSSNSKYEIHFANNKIIRIWAGEKCPQKENNEQFILVAMEDTIIFIEVAKK